MIQEYLISILESIDTKLIMDRVIEQNVAKTDWSIIIFHYGFVAAFCVTTCPIEQEDYYSSKKTRLLINVFVLSYIIFEIHFTANMLKFDLFR